MAAPPDGAMGEGNGSDEAFAHGPGVELGERGDRAVPGRGRDAEAGVLAPAGAVKGIDVGALGLPDVLAARIGEKAQPDDDIVAAGAQRVTRARAAERQVEEETVEIGIVERAVAQDHGHVRVEAGALRAAPQA